MLNRNASDAAMTTHEDKNFMLTGRNVCQRAIPRAGNTRKAIAQFFKVFVYPPSHPELCDLCFGAHTL